MTSMEICSPTAVTSSLGMPEPDATLNSVALSTMQRGAESRTHGNLFSLTSGGSAGAGAIRNDPHRQSLTGGLDEVFQRADNNATVVLLADALGSTVALVDCQRQHEYDILIWIRSGTLRGRERQRKYFTI